MRVLVVNAGSSSVKLSLLDGDDRVAREELPPVGEDGVEEALEGFLGRVDGVEAVGHRFVTGGPDLRDTVRIDDDVRAVLDDAAHLAPLHVPSALAALDLVRARLGVPQIACFDTGFHSTIPDAAAVYAVPWSWTADWGVRRLGFHGFGHRWAAERAADLTGRPLAELRVVTCHLGSGASLAAVDRGRCVDTTMGFTPAEGLVMGTRSGSVDPGVLVWALRTLGLGADALEHALERESGLLALSGLSSSAREVEIAAGEGHDRSRLALDVWAHRVRAGVAAMAAAMGGLDALAFTGGIGEASPTLRAAACDRLAFLGVELDPDGNENAQPDAVLSPPGSAVTTVAVAAREDLVMAREVRRLLGGRPPVRS